MSTAPAAGETGPGGVHVRAGGTRITGGQTAQRAVAAPGDRQVSTSGSAVTARGRAQGHAPAHGMPLVQRVAQPAGLGPVGAGGSVAAGEPAGATRMPPAPALVLARSTTTIVASAHDQPMSGPAGTLGGAGTSATVLRDATDPVAPDAAQPDDGGGAPGGAPGEGTSTSTTARAAPSATGSVAERDLDEMVRRLYPRLRRSLSSELLVARERAGTLADLR
jgi:hypothetical protein